MSLSSGSPGCTLFWIPSIAAIVIALNARYGLHELSGHRNSSRLVFGFSLYIGIRIAADRFRDEYTRFTGASYPGTSRLYEFVVGFVNAHSALACFRIPPIAYNPMSESPAYLFPANSGLSPFHSEKCTCIPDPLSWNSGLGMNVTTFPCRAATFLATYLYVMTLSDIVRMSW